MFSCSHVLYSDCEYDINFATLHNFLFLNGRHLSKIESERRAGLLQFNELRHIQAR